MSDGTAADGAAAGVPDGTTTAATAAFDAAFDSAITYDEDAWTHFDADAFGGALREQLRAELDRTGAGSLGELTGQLGREASAPAAPESEPLYQIGERRYSASEIVEFADAINAASWDEQTRVDEQYPGLIDAVLDTAMRLRAGEPPARATEGTDTADPTDPDAAVYEIGGITHTAEEVARMAAAVSQASWDELDQLEQQQPGLLDQVLVAAMRVNEGGPARDPVADQHRAARRSWNQHTAWIRNTQRGLI